MICRSDSEEEDNNEVVECPASVHSKPESSQVVEMNPSKRHAGSADIEYIEDYDDLETYSLVNLVPFFAYEHSRCLLFVIDSLSRRTVAQILVSLRGRRPYLSAAGPKVKRTHFCVASVGLG